MKDVINLSEDFTKFPGLRYKEHTPNASGEEFRENYLVPALAEHEKITVVLDGNIGSYLPSFLEEAFGGLVRKNNYSYSSFQKKIILISNDDPTVIDDINYYVKRAVTQ